MACTFSDSLENENFTSLSSSMKHRLSAISRRFSDVPGRMSRRFSARYPKLLQRSSRRMPLHDETNTSGQWRSQMREGSRKGGEERAEPKGGGGEGERDGTVLAER